MNRVKIFKLFLIFTLITAALSGLGFLYITYNLPQPEEIKNRKVAESTKIYDRTGKILLYEIRGEEKRTIIPANDIPEIIKYATISIEDDSFYTHPAFDWRGIVRAITIDILRGTASQGGSTITQQLAKSAFLNPERTITRKIKELVLAWRLENYYNKDEILALYLNQIPYGANTYGIEAASQTYFAKPAKELTLNEAALLAAIPKAPSYYAPWGSHIDELKARKNSVLKRMKDLGYIDDEEMKRASEELPKIISRPATGIRAPHFVIYVQDYLNKKYGEELLQTGGFKITTTLDWDLEQIAEKAVEQGVERNSELYGGENAALVAEDPQTGQILALVGSKNYFAPPAPKDCIPGDSCKFEGNFNVATQGLRQPGSALKPFVYLTSFQKGLTPDTLLWDVPTEFAPNNPLCPPIVDFKNENPACYHPENYDNFFRGPIAIKQALAESINITAVKALYFAGLNDSVKNLENFGITTLKDINRFGLSLVLGGGEVKLVELVGAYSVLANDGAKHDTAIVLKIEDSNGDILEEYNDKSAQVIDPNYPRLINDILSDIELRAPLYSASLSLTKVPGQQIALKTGTSNDYRDAWTIGYTPTLVVGVWAGNNNRVALQKKGGSILAALPIWHDFTSQALKGKPLTTFNKPDQIESDNPILRGELIKDEFHNILYYLNRTNDAQFTNWEEGVKNWVQINNFDGSKFKIVEQTNTPAETTILPKSDIQIDLISPKNGDFIKDDILSIDASINSVAEINKIELYFNNNLIDSKIVNLGKTYAYKATIKPNKVDLQNLLVLKVTDSNGIKANKEVIIYK